MKKFATLLLLLSLTCTMMAQTDNDLKNAFRELLEVEKAGSSIVMVEVSEKGTRFVNYGKLSKDASAKPADEKTIYEIGSITKVFTGILLAEAVRRGEVKLDDPISKHLPKSVKVPSYGGKEITLLDLATHSSGLPRMPDNFDPKDPLNPYADYSAQRAYDFLSKYKLTGEIGTKFDYSNFGVGLLGHILSLRTKMGLEQLMKTRIFGPLKMTDTSFVLPTVKRSRHAQGLDENNDPVPNWNMDMLAGAGAIRSTATDMAKFISANLGFTKTPLATAFAESQKIYRQGEVKGQETGLCWIVTDFIGTRTVIHGGTTYGFNSIVVIAPEKKKGYFLVRNGGGGTLAFLQSVALNAINPKFPITKPDPPKKEIALSDAIFDKYVGEYQLAPDFSITVTREGKQFFIQATGQEKFEAFAEKDGEFFLKAVKAGFSITKDATGKVTGLIWHQGGADTPAKKIK